MKVDKDLLQEISSFLTNLGAICFGTLNKNLQFLVIFTIFFQVLRFLQPQEPRHLL